METLRFVRLEGMLQRKQFVIGHLERYIMGELLSPERAARPA